LFYNQDLLFIDKRYNPFIEKLDEYILDISSVDATGQTFRYPVDNESKKHLTEVSNISVVILK